MKNELENRICPYSGEEFRPKRRNQIYAKPEYRIAHNNEKGKAKREKTSLVNKALSKNREILERILESKTTATVHKEFLRGAGFSFRVFTHLVQDKDSKATFYGVYGHAFKKIDNEHYKIIRNG
jgi:hypothetical protein